MAFRDLQDYLREISLDNQLKVCNNRVSNALVAELADAPDFRFSGAEMRESSNLSESTHFMGTYCAGLAHWLGSRFPI